MYASSRVNARPLHSGRLAGVRVVAFVKSPSSTGSQKPARPGWLNRSKDDASFNEVSLRKALADKEDPGPKTPSKAPLHNKTTRPAPQTMNPTEVQWPPRRPFVAIAWDNAMDSVAETHRHLKRLAAPLPDLDPFHRLIHVGKDEPLKLAATKKPVVLVLGSGWGSHRLSKIIDHEAFDVVVVSPRNHFVFTPMLPAAAVGSVEARSLLEPVRVSNPFVTYFEATCDTINLASKTAVCTSAFKFEDGTKPQFKVQYDKLVVAVGEQPASFGVPGVREHCYFIKEITDSLALRTRIGSLFELCSLPSTSEADRHRNLHFVVVGGGPTGVEFSGTLADYLKTDLKKKYPHLMKYVKVTLLETTQTILSPFQKTLQQRAIEGLRDQGVELRLGVRVVAVTDKQVKLAGGESIETGAVVWSAGNSARQLVKDLVAAIPEQAQFQRGPTPVTNKLAVDPFLRVIGARDVFAIGDNSVLVGSRLPPTGQVAAQQGSYLAHLLNAGYDVGRGGMFEAPPTRPREQLPLPPLPPSLSPVKSFLMGGDDRVRVGAEVSKQLEAMEEPPWAAAARTRARGGLSIPPLLTPRGATSAKKEGAAEAADVRADVEFQTRPFEFLDFGIMAYMGDDKALTQLQAFDLGMALHGQLAYLLWRSVYLTKQVNMRNRILILADWLKTRIFGRDLNLLV